MLEAIYDKDKPKQGKNNRVRGYPPKNGPNPTEMSYLSGLSKVTAANIMGLAWIFIDEDDIF